MTQAIAIISAVGISILAVLLWLWRWKKRAQESAIRDREYLQGQADHKRNLEANKKHGERSEKIKRDYGSSTVDPDDPWFGVRGSKRPGDTP